MKRYTVLILAVFCFLQVFSGDFSTFFSKGNSYYMSKNYKQALVEYKKAEQILSEKGKHSFKLYYNLGCTYFRLGDIAYARYYFEKAKKIKPFDQDLNKNLSLVVSQLKDSEKKIKQGFFLNFYSKVYLAFGLNTLTFVTLLFFMLIFLFLALLISGRFERKKIYYGIGISLFCFLLSFTLFYSRYKYTFAKEAVVFSQEADVFSEPNTSSTVLFKLHKGAKVSVEEELNGYAHISLPDGLNGWIDEQYIKEL